jgi:predicted alpha/beta-fold hydrolase
VTLWQPAHGGHVGFATGRFPGQLKTLPAAVLDWLADHLEATLASVQCARAPGASPSGQ